MDTFPFTIVIGIVVGFLCAIPPGPLNVTIISKASGRLRKQAYRVALGGGLVDAVICGAIGLGFGWALERVVTKRWVKSGLALFLVLYGLKILFLDRRRDAARARLEAASVANGTPAPAHLARKGRLPVLMGFLQGAANPTLIVNWTFIISFLVGHGLMKTTMPAQGGFALGIGLGVFGWFALLIEILERFHDHPIGAWLRRSTVYAGILLILFGAYFALRSFVVWE
jgi:threonine/homoserine/homoserine lactone efflux protein